MRFDALRRSPSAVRIALVLWSVWAVIVWNVVFDHVIVAAGREYIAAANRAADSSTLPHRYEDMDAWMRPAVSRGFWTATASSGVVLLTGLGLARAARAPQ